MGEKRLCVERSRKKREREKKEGKGEDALSGKDEKRDRRDGKKR